MKYGYDIDGNEIIIAYCTHCKHEMSLLRQGFLLKCGSPFDGSMICDNDLYIMDKIADCCDNPSYFWD